MKSINPSGSRVNIGPDDSWRVASLLAKSPELKVVQFFEPVSSELLASLNAELFSQRPDVELRAYGFPGKICDLSFCSLLPNLRKFRADSLQEAVGVETISAIPQLTLLGIGIESLESFDFLRDVSPAITELSLGETRSKKPDLTPVGRFKSLKRVSLTGQQKKVEALGECLELEVLMLRSVTLDSLEIIRALPRLWSLDLKLGGTSDLSALKGLENLKYLELWRIRGLENIEVISTLIGLESLFLQTLGRVSAIPPLERLTRLRKVHLEELSGLTDISSLAGAPALEELRHIASKSRVEDYLPLLESRTLRTAHVGFGSVKKNQRFKELCHAKGIANDVATGVTPEMILKRSEKEPEAVPESSTLLTGLGAVLGRLGLRHRR